MSLFSNSTLLQKSMQLNGAFSMISALICLLFSQSVASLMGFDLNGADQITSQGISLMVFSIFLFIMSSRLFEGKQGVLLISGSIAIILDVIWVISSIIILVTESILFSVPGKWILVTVSIFVLDFAIFQSIGAKRLIRAQKQNK